MYVKLDILSKPTNFVKVLGISETHNRDDKSSETISVEGYEVWETNRKGKDKGGGGLSLLYKSTLHCHKYVPAVPEEYQYIKNERQWLLLSGGTRRLAFLHLYIACQNNNDNSFMQWNDDLFSLVTQEALDLKRQGFFTLAMGDFNSRVGQLPGLENNTPGHNRNTSRFFRFIEDVNLLIINTLPLSNEVFTRHDDVLGGKSLLDYALIDKSQASIVNTFVIDEDARFRCGSDHSLLHCTLQFHHSTRVNWRFRDLFKYNIRGCTNYDGYRKQLDKALSSMSLEQFSHESTATKLLHITGCIHAAAKESIGFKKHKKKRGRKLPVKIVSMITAKNGLLSALRTCAPQSILEQRNLKLKLNKIKEELGNELLAHKIRKRSALRSKLMLKDPNRKKFWRFVRGQMTAASNITALRNKEGEIVFDQHEIKDVVMDHFSDIFCGQKIPVYERDGELATEDLPEGERKFNSEHFEDIVCAPYSYSELDEILSNLQNEKSTGHDR